MRLSSRLKNFFTKKDLSITPKCKIDLGEDGSEEYTQYVYRTTVKKAKENKIEKPIYNDSILDWKTFIKDGKDYNKNTYIARTGEDEAVVLYSGGTSGTPKGIMISNYSFNALAQQSAVNVIDVRPKDKIVTILPIFQGFGLGVCIHTPLCLKVETILMPEYDANRFYKIWKNDRPHVILGVPTLWEGMMSNRKFENVDMSQLKYIVSGGDYLSVANETKINEFLHKHGAHVNIAKGYGMTESVAATSYTQKAKQYYQLAQRQGYKQALERLKNL